MEEIKKKFWCHYIGSDGKTPRRRNMELTKLTIQDATLWADFEPCSYNSGYYHLYYQLSDKVAVTCNQCLRVTDWEEMNKSDQQFREEIEERRKDNPSCWNEEDVEMCVSNSIKSRDHDISNFKKLANLTDFLLNESGWVMLPQLAAYREVNHPQYDALMEKRKACEEIRRQREEQRKEEERKRKEEEERKAKEEAEKELVRLNEEEIKFKNGESISGEDVVTLCKRHGINVHLRTIHNLRELICEINGMGNCRYWKQRGKRMPVLDGCYKAAEELYNKLNEEPDVRL